MQRLRLRLFALVAAALLPVFVFAAILVLNTALDERDSVKRGMLDTSRALSLAADRELRVALATLRTLATSPLLRDGDFAGFRDQSLRVLETTRGWLSLVDETGQQWMNTRLKPEDPLPRTDNYEWLNNVFSGQPYFISGAVTGPVVRTPFVAISLLVGRPGRREVLTLSIAPETLAALLEEQRLPGDSTGIITDGSGTVIGRSKQSQAYSGVRLWHPGVGSGGVERLTLLDNTRTYFAWTRSSFTGWYTGVALPVGAVDGPLYRSLAALGGVGLVAAILGSVLALLAARGISRPIRRLAEGVQALDLNEAPPPAPAPASNIREIGNLERAFADMLLHLRGVIGHLRQEQRERLAVLETLEERVRERTRQLQETNARLMREVRDREAAEESLRRAQRIEAVGQLTSGVAHDFNNLLTAVLGNLELAMARAPDEATVRLLSGASRAAQRGAHLTEQLLAFARRQHLQARPVDVNELVHGMDDLLGRTIGPAVRISRQLEAGLWPALADPSQLEVCILNLAINARDAMPLGGQLVIETVNIPAGDPRSPREIAGDAIMVSVTDTGTGMSEDVAQRAFEPFFTTKEVGKGSGLGLSMVYGVVRQLGGTVLLESAAGRGTTVRMFLPRSREATPAARGETAQGMRSALRSARVLLVDDDTDVRELTATMLKEIGHEVIAVESARRALETLDGGAPVDILIADVAMPVMSGIELAKQARRQRPRLPIILVTGYSEHEVSHEEFEHLIRKPFRQADLAAGIDRALGESHAEVKIVRLPRP